MKLLKRLISAIFVRSEDVDITTETIVPKEVYEEDLKEQLEELLAHDGIHNAIKSLKYNPKKEQCTVVLSVFVNDDGEISIK
jgi:sugar-specific transcriptional regulator TrmB